VNLAEALTALYARVPMGMRLGLDPMREACAREGHPERAFPVVHVAGTNGKGSTCAMVEAAARAAGKRTGMYTSPHLCRFAERIRVDGEPIGEAALVEALERALAHDLSFFEVATLAAFLAFRSAGVELGVIEVGIGGRLDATNVVESECAAITRVAFDHQDKLGETLAEIASEKAAIAKAGKPIVFGALEGEARAAAERVVRANGARIVEAVELPAGIEIGMLGAHQRENARVAWTIGREIGLGEAAIAEGIAKARWAGRLERIEAPGGVWILDGAHNPDGAEALVRALDGAGVGAVVFGALADKQWSEMLAIVSAIDAPRFHVAPKGRQAAPLGELLSLDDALALARRHAGIRPVVVCGSLYLVGEARAKLLGEPMDPVVAL
jgi:dihydrofolate synthase/folylpolyglutamate synthase